MTATTKLAHKRQTPSSLLFDYSILLYGAKKIGKSSLTAQFPNCAQLMCEPGGKAISGYVENCPSWRMFKKKARAAREDPFFKTIAIDTADECYRLCSSHVMDTLGISHPSEEDFGKGWEAIKQEFVNVLNPLLHCGKGIIFVSHDTERELRTRSGKRYTVIQTTMAKQPASFLEGVVDIWCYAHYEGTDRMLTLVGDEEISAGHRLSHHFRYTDGTPITEIAMGSNPKEGYENFVAAFENRLSNPDSDEPRTVAVTKGIKVRIKKKD